MKKHSVPQATEAPKRQKPLADGDDSDDDESGETDNLDRYLHRDIEEPVDDQEEGEENVHGGEDAVGYETWKRPPHSVDGSSDLFIQMTEIDYFTASFAPYIRLFGVTDSGNSVACFIDGFVPYFYALMPYGIGPAEADLVKDAINTAMSEAKGKYTKYVADVEMVCKQSIMGYQGGRKSTFAKISVSIPSFISGLRTLLERGVDIPGYGTACKTYESDLPYALRFMIDRDIVGGGWVKLGAAKYRVREPWEKKTTCCIEVDVHHSMVTALPADAGEFTRNSPFRIASFDIECAGRPGIFPVPEIDPVIQISTRIAQHGVKDGPVCNAIFVTCGCTAIKGAEVFTFATEREMMLAWRSFIVQTDPDVMLGYNIVGFDLPYLINRAAALKIPNFCALGRVKGQLTTLKKATFQSKAYGKRESFDAAMIGRVTTDMLVCIQREHKLRSYTLNYVSAEFLDEQKDDVHHSMITTLYKGSDDDRRTLAKYCLKDALLPLRLSEKLMTFYNQIEMARVTGVPISYLLSRGQQIKVISQLYRKAKTEGFLIPYHKVEKQAGDDGVAYEGATVIEPKRGFYQAPVATLDFASLYPSIMMAHNLCYCALISKKDTVEGGGKLVLDVDYIRTPAGHLFVKPELQKGLLPRILADLLAQRKKAKTELKTEKDPQKRAVLDGRQLALKVSANSVYGFTGATIGKLPCLEISASVTAFGREMIELSKRIVEETYTVAGGYSHDAVVLYGDTDSIMVKFGTEDLATAMKYGREAAVLITKRFVKPISLEFEKVYWPYLLINKKRYAGLYWTNAEKYDKLDTKGIEVNRRDNFPYLPSVMSKSLNMLLIENNPEGAKAFVRQSISDLLQDKVDMSQLILSKQLSRAAKDYAGKQAHVELAARMAKRDPGSAPKIGDRVPYVITEAHKGAKAFEKSEEPIYAMENGLRLDIAWYIERMYKPLERIFGAVMGNVDSLFRGEHTRTIVRPQAVSGALSRFMKKTERCLGCAALLENEAAAVCEKCAPTAPLIYQQLLEEANEAEQKYARIWTQCQACQGSHHTTIDCSNNECPIFYERAKNKIVAGKTQKELAKFQNIAW